MVTCRSNTDLLVASDAVNIPDIDLNIESRIEQVNALQPDLIEGNQLQF